MVAVDPLASLSPREVIVRLGTRDYAIPPLPAIDWLEVLLTNTAVTILPGWFGAEDRNAFYAAAMRDEFGDDELDDATSEAITVAAGRPWWLAAALVSMASADTRTWATLHGRLVLAGVDARTVSLGAWMDALHAAVLEALPGPEARQRFEIVIETPPEGVGVDEEAEAAAFMALAGTLGMDVEGDGADDLVAERTADPYPLD